MTIAARVLHAFYDLSVSPTSFDCATFLALAELHRSEEGGAGTKVIFVPAAGSGFWEREQITLAERRARLANLLVPLCALWPGIVDVAILADRAEAVPLLRQAQGFVYPAGYTPEAPVTDSFQWSDVLAARCRGAGIPAWRAPTDASESVARWIDVRSGGRRVVTITLREASYHVEQNSNVEAWGAFADRLDRARYFPVFVRDTETARAPPPPALAPFATFLEASLDVRLRAALYAQSHLCLNSSTGPQVLLWLNPACCSVVFGLLNAQNQRMAPMPLRSMGLEIGTQMFGAGINHRLVWERDRLEVIEREFAKAEAALSASPAEVAARLAAEAESPLRLARRLRRSGRHPAALTIYRDMLRRSGHRAAPLCGLSLTELDIRRRPDVARLLRGGSYYARARLAGLGRWQSADEALEIALCLARWRRPIAAEKLFRAILARWPNEPLAHYGLACIARSKNRFDEAMTELRAALANDPYTGRYHLELAELLTTEGEAGEARDHYRLALLYDPSLELAAARLGRGAPEMRDS
jgi:tetratricopeptide (TPR) repeat protein